jgi:predicted DNA-binding transcriptional regulator AlpA
MRIMRMTRIASKKSRPRTASKKSRPRRRTAPSASTDRGAEVDPPSTVSQHLSARDIAKLTTLHRATVWRLARQGAMPAPVQLSTGRHAWRESDIARWLEERAARR